MTEITLNEDTTKMLKNFSGVNDQILFRPGNTITTVSKGKKMIGMAYTDLNIDRVFGIDKLSQLLSAISLFQAPKIILNDHYLTIKDDSRLINYTYTEPENVLSLPPNKEKEIPFSPTCTFKITSEVLKDIQKASGVLNSLPDVGIVANGKKITARVFNHDDPTSHVYSVDLGETTEKFQVYQKSEHFNKLFSSNYDVSVDPKNKFCRFDSQNGVLTYWLAMEA